MNYIIDPMLFYNMSIFDSLKLVTSIFGFIFGCGMIAAIVCYIYNRYELGYFKIGDYPSKDEKIEEYTHALRICKHYILLGIVLTIIFVSLAIFIPSKTVCIEMIVAKNITSETVNGGIEVLKEAIDYIFSKIQTLQ